MGKTYVKKKSWSGEMWKKRRFGYNPLSKKKYKKERKEERAEVAKKINAVKLNGVDVMKD